MSRYFLDGETFVPDFEKCHLCHREEERKSECVCEKETERETKRESKERKEKGREKNGDEKKEVQKLPIVRKSDK